MAAFRASRDAGLLGPPPRRTGCWTLGNPEALRWLVDHFDRSVKEQGVECPTAEDFNMDQLPYWRANDAPDRQGLTENHHVQGHLTLWDELPAPQPWPLDRQLRQRRAAQRPGDFAGVRLRCCGSDYVDDPDAQQCQTMGISLWMPYHGSGLMTTPDVYKRRSYLLPLHPCLRGDGQAGARLCRLQGDVGRGSAKSRSSCWATSTR